MRAPATTRPAAPRRATRPRAGWTIALAIGLGLVGCAGSDAADRPARPATTGSPSTTGEAAPTDAEVAAFCTALTDFATLTSAAPNGTLQELKDSAALLLLAATQLAESGPPELEDPLDALASRFGELNDVIAASATVEEARAGAQAAGPDPLIGDAGRQIGDYATEHCPS